MIRFHVLDSFRGICAISVVIFHIHAVNSLTEWEFFRNAYLFVPFFFSLSAFVLSHKYYSRNFDSKELKNMIINRIFRLWPLHITMLLVFLVLESGKLFAETQGIGFTYPAFSGENSTNEILPNLLLIHAWLNSFSDLSYNYPAWSISVEMGLYFVFATILYTFTTLRSYVFIFVAILFYFLLVKRIDHLRMHAFLGLFCFSMGVLTYRLYDNIKHISINNRVMTGLEIFSIVLVYLILILDIGNKYIASTLVFCLTILVFSFEAGVTSRLLKLSPFTYLGKVSYSVYMTHAAIIFSIIAVLKILSKVTNTPLQEMHPIINAGSHITVSYFDIGSPLINNGLVLLIMLTVIATSNFTYRFIEQPGQKLGRILIARSSENSSNIGNTKPSP